LKVLTVNEEFVQGLVEAFPDTAAEILESREVEDTPYVKGTEEEAREQYRKDFPECPL